MVNTEDEPLKVTKAQNWLVDLARSVAMTNDVPVNDFPHGVVLMNTNQGILFGQQGVGPLSATGATVSRACSGRKGPPYGLDHSRRAGSLADYQDSWDIMSTLNSCYMVPGVP